ncbi:stromal cell-derived factor 2-like [Branchiostoma lanceolatum]|uniref:stromal cell-derived factor 2-like n=1 Tax=Branchiostoma lanceolatum TaxID=7740 RepID=UPI003452F1C9
MATLGCSKTALFYQMSSFFFCLLLSFALCEDFEYPYVTCGSVVKLLNTRNNVRLHSHDVKYGSGSGQQSVTAVDSSDDTNSYWAVKGKADKPCVRGTPIKCGQTIRLMHTTTRRNLHSHYFQSPLSRNQEVSAFGTDGLGDTGDYWAVTCSGTYWERDDMVRFKHTVTEMYLHITGDTYGRPIHGQREVCAYPKPDSGNFWRVMEGVFIKPTETSSGGKR